MAPSRAMTGDTILSEKHDSDVLPPNSPTNTDDTDATLRGDAIINIMEEEDDHSSRTSSVAGSSASGPPTQPQKRPTFINKVTGSFSSQPDPLAVTETNTRRLENTPNGFPRLAAFQSSEANFALYRSFSYLHSRLLLHLQDDITNLEKELDEIDWDDFDEDPNRLRSREYDSTHPDGNTRNRKQVMREIKEKLMEYDDVLIKAQTLEAFQRPSDRNYRSVRRYHHNTKPLMDSEMDSIRAKEDIVSLRSGREWASFDGGVESLLHKLDKTIKFFFRTKEPPLQRLFRTPELREKTTNKYINFYSSSRIDKLVGILITIIIFILLAVPVVVLYHLTSSSSHPITGNSTFNAIGILIVFTLLFSAAMSLLTKAARHELFAASAAYCAILVVFIGNFTGPGN